MNKLSKLLLMPLVFSAAPDGVAALYQVGPTRTYSTLQAVQGMLAPGDVVEVDGNVTYPGGAWFQQHGQPGNPITIRGVRVNGNRPHLHAGAANVVRLEGDHYIFEGFEISGATSPVLTTRGIFCVAHDLVVRDTVVHDCPRHGILGADQGSGDVLLEHVEVYNCGEGDRHHSIYMATDQTNYPNAVFTMHHCYIHDATGGVSVKSRCGRSEILYNWISGGYYHELDLIGLDPGGQLETGMREDFQVIGNVLEKSVSSLGIIARIGGDGTGDSYGRFRFVNNTLILQSGGSNSVIRLQDHVESLEFYNNVVYRPGSSTFTLIRTVELAGTCAHAGANNWIDSQALSSGIPSAWTGSIIGTDPGFTDAGTRNFIPTTGSPLINAAAASTPSPSGFPFPNPLAVPAFHPPLHAVEEPGSEVARPQAGTLDIGAFELEGIPAGISRWEVY